MIPPLLILCCMFCKWWRIQGHNRVIYIYFSILPVLQQKQCMCVGNLMNLSFHSQLSLFLSDLRHSKNSSVFIAYCKSVRKLSRPTSPTCRWQRLFLHKQEEGKKKNLYCVTRQFSLSVCLFLPVFDLLLHPRPGVLLGVPEDQLRAEDGGDAGGRGHLQRGHPADALLAAGRIQQCAVPHRHLGQVPTKPLPGSLSSIKDGKRARRRCGRLLKWRTRQDKDVRQWDAEVYKQQREAERDTNSFCCILDGFLHRTVGIWLLE